MHWATDVALTPPTDVDTTSDRRTHHRIAICIFGVVARSIKHTWPSLETHLLAPLRSATGVEPQIFVFNQQPRAGTRVDGLLLNQSDIDIIPVSYRVDVRDMPPLTPMPRLTCSSAALEIPAAILHR